MVINLTTATQLKLSKASLITKAIDYRKTALGHIYDAELLCPLIPDLENGEHMKAILFAAITAITAKSSFMKILGVGLPLIGSLEIEMYDKFVQMRKHLELSIILIWHNFMIDYH